MIDAFLQRFPLWPRALAEKFSAVLAFAVSSSNEFETAKEFYIQHTQKQFYNKIRVTDRLPYNYQFTIPLLNAQNERYRRRNVAQLPRMPYPINAMPADGGLFQLGLSEALGIQFIEPYIVTTYDERIFSNIQPSVTSEFIIRQGSIGFSYLSIMSYTNALVNYGDSYLIASVAANVKPFNGLASIIALHENGATLPNVDISQIYDFATYVNAYDKFSAELQAEQNLLSQKANIAVNDYRQQLDDQAAREYADLQAKKIQLLIAIDNDAKSAQRDFQNMLLTAQGLKNQIRGNLV